jgi:hypothetical protein
MYSVQKSIILSIIFLSFVNPSFADEDDGYNWAEENEVTTFKECQAEYGTSSEEDGCNRYVQEQLYGGTPSLHGQECTEDCSGHQAGYDWAEENDINDVDDCDGNSESFNEGCESYVLENQ